MFGYLKDKKLYRSPRDGMVFGVLSGFGRFFRIDPVFLRVAFIVVAVLTKIWVAAAVYVVAVFLMPIDPAQDTVEQHQTPRDVTEA